MERATLLRTISCSSSSSVLVSARFFSRSTHRLYRLPKRHRLIPNIGHSSLFRRHIGLVSAASRPSLHLKKHFSNFSVQAVATSNPQSAPEALGADDSVAEKLGFEKVSEEFIEECKSRAVLYKHKKTGAEIMSVSNEDENKVFGIVFRTPPKDSTGIPHILEHSVLCGSRKYPLKEPFVELLKGSLHTFLNAFTYPDRTCYPVASTNTKDFYNLVDVYLDAVFFPKCVNDIKTFQQEGWHYELNDPSEDITYKGVVFNEMKGVYSQPESILGRASQQALFPDNAYGVDSGGDPQVIPKLTFEEFKEFHCKYYHPSNARIWFYGDDDPTERLQILSGTFFTYQCLLNTMQYGCLYVNSSNKQPDPEKASYDEAIEKENLEKVKASMTPEDLAELARATHELKLKQETPDPPEALKCVPSLSLQDIPKKPKHIPTEVGYINGIKVLQHDLFTNDVLYAEVVFNMSSLKQELLPLVPLFCQSLLEMGTKDMEFVQLNQLIGRKTGGISVYPFTSSVRDKKDPCSHIIVRGKAMSERSEDLFNLVNCVLQDVQLTDQKRFKQFVSQSKARMENRLRGSGHGIAAARMDAKLNVAGWISEQMGGLSYLEFLQALEKKVDEDWPEISASLEEIRKTLISKNGCLINLTADGKNLKNSEKHISNFLDMLPNTSPVGSIPLSSRLSPTNEAIVIPTQVNYVGKAANICDTGYKLKGSAYVISKYLNNTWLWDRVRVSGGAYGGFCDFDTHSGVFSYLSYRDPNLLETLDVYDGTSNFLKELEMDDDALTKAIIGTIGDVDAYQLPDAKGYSSLMRHLLGVTEEERQMRREEILLTRLNDFKDFADFIEMVKDKGVVVAVASPGDVDAANKLRPNFFEVKKAL
ncbi:presequence protease 1, chloroplastic/mitochondrial-like isoform X2 [Primulina tabacum]|uniref:presequence protease 1, chloroplastic/mitochondrial-like isoform X2 n=1 Tax=Primulina tabacum TaxID=48773 RepID=UPI003F59EE4B